VRITLVLTALVSLTLTVPAASDEKQLLWPPLPVTGFIKGRAATTDDVASGAAAFALQSKGKADGRPLDIEIPQYALLRDDKTGRDIPVIIIQAETNGAMEVVGCIGIFDKVVRIATLKEVKLLGTDVHKLPAPNNRWSGP